MSPLEFVKIRSIIAVWKPRVFKDALIGIITSMIRAMEQVNRHLTIEVIFLIMRKFLAQIHQFGIRAMSPKFGISDPCSGVSSNDKIRSDCLPINNEFLLI